MELAKLFNRPLSVFDQERGQWYTWQHGGWQEDTPKISHPTLVGSGTRDLTDAGRAAIDKLFADAFGPA